MCGLTTAGLGDSNGRSVPTLVKDIGVVGQVACGSLHTLVVSADGWTIWSFGDGDGGEKNRTLISPLADSAKQINTHAVDKSPRDGKVPE